MMRDAYQRPATVAYVHSREQHRFYCFQQSTTFHSNFGYRDTQAITKLPSNYFYNNSLLISISNKYYL